MAAMQVTLSLFTFNQIGSLYQDEQTSDFFIGPEVETGKGPWASATNTMPISQITLSEYAHIV
jgi:hypothetical protein